MSKIIAGVDEVGRGPLAGPVVAAAVILDPSIDHPYRDSKKLSASKRAKLAAKIKAESVAWSLGLVSAAEIDALNILNATMLAMQRAVAGLRRTPHLVRVDGNRCPDLSMPAEALIGGDDADPAIAAASIIAKVTRDAWMVGLAERHPEYGFDGHKGYPTKAHLAALMTHGVTPQHRRSFAPVTRALRARSECGLGSDSVEGRL